MDRFYLTTPIYYVNDRPHIGHAYSTIAADVLARFWRRQLGDDRVWFLTGTDEHGAKIERAAEKAGKTPHAFTNEIAEAFRATWEKLGLNFNDFIRTTEPRHEKAVTAFLLALKDAATPKGNPAVFEGEYEGFYCTGHEAFMRENDLVDGVCPDHKIKPELVKEKNWFFKLSDFQEELGRLIETDELEIRPLARKNEMLNFIKQGLEDITISRPHVKWGIPVPFDAGQTVYVWVDALINYVSAIGYGEDRQRLAKWWPANLHIVGKDIAKFHCIIWPALLLAVGLEPPKKVFAHGFFTIDREKISKSIGNVIDPVELANRYGNDALRYFLLSEITFGEDGDFSEEKLKQVYNGELANTLGNYVARVAALAEKGGAISIPDREKFLATINETPTPFARAVAELRFHEALGFLWEELHAHDKELQEQELWKEGDEKVLRGKLFHHIEFILWLNHLLEPFLPDTYNKILEKVNISQNILRVKKGESLFPRIEN